MQGAYTGIYIVKLWPGMGWMIQVMCALQITAVSSKTNTTETARLGAFTEGVSQLALYDTPGVVSTRWAFTNACRKHSCTIRHQKAAWTRVSTRASDSIYSVTAVSKGVDRMLVTRAHPDTARCWLFQNDLEPMIDWNNLCPNQKCNHGREDIEVWLTKKLRPVERGSLLHHKEVLIKYPIIHSFITRAPIQRSGALQHFIHGSSPCCPILGCPSPSTLMC